jgi:hypothetical protein
VNEDWMAELEPRAGEELERKLDRYARLRLDPSPGQAKRARGAVMEAAWRQRLDASASGDRRPGDVEAASAAVVAPGARRGLYGGWSPRRLGTALAAAVLAGLLVGSTAFASTRAGGPLYDARLAFEELTLPADPQARLEAELALAQARLAEIVEAVARDDRNAVAAATRGYMDTLDELDESTGAPADRALAAVEQHQDILRVVLERVPEQARSGIETALTRSSAVIAVLDAAGTPAPGGAGNGGGNGGGNGNGGNGNGTTGGSGNGSGNGGGGGSGNGGNGNESGNGGGNGNGGNGNGNGGAARTPAPDSTATPQATDRPDRTAKPPRTPPPARTPAPDATSKPGGQGDKGSKP